MRIREITDADVDAVVALWAACGLTRPWNDPVADIELCRRGPASTVLVGVAPPPAGAPVASVMTGSDGHRGWMYYLAVAPGHRARGAVRAMVRAAETWLCARGVPKAELMIRDDNAAVRAFYERVGYEVEPRLVMSRWLRDEGR